MPVVEVNGQELEFPDDMDQEAIKAVLRQKFPPAAPSQATQFTAPSSFSSPAVIPSPLDVAARTLPDEVKNVLARTGRIATGIAGGALDLPSTVGQLAYDATRGAQANLGARVAPEYQVPLPSQGLKAVYDMATGGVGRSTGDAETFDTLAEIGAPIAGLATKVIPAAVKYATPRATGVVKQLAQRATEMGIPLRVDQIAPSRAMNTAQKISQEVPFSGVDASEARQVQAWNRKLAGTLGQDADNLGPEVIEKFKIDTNAKFNNALADAKISITPKDVKALDDIQQQAPSRVGTNSLGIVKRNIKTALKDLELGPMNGDKLANIRSYFMANLAEAEGGAKQSIGKIINVIDDIAARNVSPQKAKDLAEVRREWRNYRTVEPLLDKSPDGNINPTELMNRVRGNRYIKAHAKKIGEDELVDLARIGKQFLVKKGGSDTFQKSAAGISLGGLGALTVTNPVLAAQAAAMAGAGMGANRGLQALNQSPAAIRTALTGRNFNPNISNALAAVASGALMKPLNGE